MRFMMLMIPGVYQGGRAGADFTPPADMVERMTKYNESLARAGMLIALDGLQPPANGARISVAGGKPRVTDGPFAESKEVVGGYWMIRAKSTQEAIEWVKRCPAQEGDIVEVRPVFEMSDFPPDVQKAADNPIVKEQIEKAAAARS